MKNIALLGRSTSMEKFAILAKILNDEHQGIKSVPVEYTNSAVKEVEKNLIENFEYVICWVDPVSFNKDGEEETRANKDGGNNDGLDQMLRRVATRGIKVSTHPDVIERMGTKRVLFDTKDQPWGLPSTKFYKTKEDLRENLWHSLISSNCRVLKMERGSSGRGVWRCDVTKRPNNDTTSFDEQSKSIILRVQHAGDDSVENDVSLDTLLGRLDERMKTTGGGVIDMPFLPRVDQGIIRCYMFRNRCGGILHQLSLPQSDEKLPSKDSPYPNLNVSKSKKYRTEGLPAGKCVHPPNSPDYQNIVKLIEKDWVPRLSQKIGLSTFDEVSVKTSLPVVWDIDFIRRTPKARELPENKSHAFDLSYSSNFALCEINVSCVFPAELMKRIADEIVSWATEEIKR